MQELSWQEAEAILRRNHVGRLACYSPIHDASYIVPMSYAYNGLSIYLGMLPGQKLEFLREHPRGVCFEVDEITNDQNWLSAIATGNFEELSGRERYDQSPAAIRRALHGPLRSSLYTDNVRTDWQKAEQRLQLCVVRISGLTARQDRWNWDVDLPKSLELAAAGQP